MSSAEMRAADVHGAAALPAPPRRDISLGELDALMRKYDMHVFYMQSSSDFTASGFDGKLIAASGETFCEAIMALVALIEGRS